MALTKKRIGLVCPYGWDTPGGVQSHVNDLAQYLISEGHEVSVLAPTLSDENLPDFVVSAGRPISIPYNGAVARILFGPIAFARVRSWISQGDFDILHLHEPAIPSISLLACYAAEGPLVGTFHAAAKRQKVSFAVVPFLEPVIEKLTARIAVSEAARLTLTEHLETDAIVVPNGIYADRYRDGESQARWQGSTIGFMGRFEEPRKGLPILIEALPRIVANFPAVRVFIAGPGDVENTLSEIEPMMRDRLEFLGRVSEKEKADFLSSVGVYVAPNTGGESFGIILAEALASGAKIVASDIPAFDSLLGNGAYGTLFESENSEDLAEKIISVFSNPVEAAQKSALGKEYAQAFDWKVVAEKIFDIYEMAMVDGRKVTLSSDARSWNRLLGRSS
jgi:phosphatidylinositol alpha-mannosyltransferase